MGSDCTVGIDDGYLNIRVGAIIMKDGKFLMVGNEDHDYIYSVGGRVKFGETAEEAVEREVFEETGYHMEVDHLGFITEYYYYGDDPKRQGKLIYELAFYFYMKTPETFEPDCKSYTENNSKEMLIWADADTPKEMFPDYFRKELYQPSAGVKHMVIDER